jgi:hypothetical protein
LIAGLKSDVLLEILELGGEVLDNYRKAKTEDPSHIYDFAKSAKNLKEKLAEVNLPKLLPLMGVLQNGSKLMAEVQQMIGCGDSYRCGTILGELISSLTI